MRVHLIRVLGLVIGLTAVLAMASVAAAAPLSDLQISRQIENRLSKDDALENVTVSVQESVARLSGTVPSLWAKTKAIAEAREEDVTTVVSDALDIESAESDRAIADQIAIDIWRVSIPGPTAAARPGVTTAPGIAESRQPPGRFGRHGADFGSSHGQFDHPGSFGRDPFDHPGSFGRDPFDHPGSFGRDPFDHAGSFGREPFDHPGSFGREQFGSGGQSQLQSELDQALYGHSSNAFYGIFDYVGGSVEDGVVALTGYVTHGYKASKMVEFVSRVEGVQEIQNQIEVLPLSALDNRLRVSLATNIYGNELFWTDATRQVPPVRIIVDNLHVTLSGVVVSEVEKRVAADIVQQTPGVLSFQNNLEIAGQISG